MTRTISVDTAVYVAKSVRRGLCRPSPAKTQLCRRGDAGVPNATRRAAGFAPTETPAVRHPGCKRLAVGLFEPRISLFSSPRAPTSPRVKVRVVELVIRDKFLGRF